MNKLCKTCGERIIGVRPQNSNRIDKKTGKFTDGDYPMWVCPTLMAQCACTAKGKNPVVADSYQALCNIRVAYEFSARNKSVCMGCYYPEDDWEIVEYGNTLEELADKVAKKLVETEIEIENPELSKVRLLTYEDQEFKLGWESFAEVETEPFIQSVKESETYKNLIEAKRVEAEKEKKEKEEQAKKALEERERAEYARLKATYELIERENQEE